MARTVQREPAVRESPRNHTAGPSQRVRRASSVDPVPDAPKKKAKKCAAKTKSKSSKAVSSTVDDGADDAGAQKKNEDVPDPVEWDDPQIYKPYRSFRRNDSGVGSIHVGSFVDVLGDSSPGMTRPRWVGQVKAIRAKTSNEVYMRIKWCFNTATQLREYNVQFPKQFLADNEVVMSNFEDIVSVWSVEGPATVHAFDEVDPWQDEIDSDDEYYRSEIVESKGRRRLVSYHPIRKNEKAYRPLPYGTTPMVFCPNKSCMKWHHQGDLQKIDEPSQAQLKEMCESGLEALTLSTRPAPPVTEETPAADKDANVDKSPDADNVDPQTQATDTNDTSKTKSKRKSKSMTSGTGSGPGFGIETILRFAESSITRGEYSIVGNARAVLEAREVIAAMKSVDDTSELISKWAKVHDPVEDDDEPRHRWICPKCKHVI